LSKAVFLEFEFLPEPNPDFYYT